MAKLQAFICPANFAVGYSAANFHVCCRRHQTWTDLTHTSWAWTRVCTKWPMCLRWLPSLYEFPCEYECLTAYGTWFLRHLHNRALFWGVETGVLSMRSSQIDDHTLFYYVWTVLTLVGLVVESAVIDWLTIDKGLSSGVNLIFFLCPLLGPTYKFTRQKFTQPKNCKFHHSPMTCLG